MKEIIMNPKIEIAIDVAAKPPTVFEALTETSKLEQWFAERAFVSASESRFDFWGRFTPGHPGPDSGRHALRAFEPPRKLAFDWKLRGKETRVDIALDETKDGTLVRLEHDAPLRAGTEMSLADFWLLSFENLRRFVEDGKAPVRCDYSSTPRGRVDLAVDIDADPEEVFDALMRPEKLDVWMAAKSEVEPRVGGRYRFGWPGEGPIRILDLVPGEKLSYSWAHAGDPETVVTWTLEGSGGKTRLELVHSGFGDRDTEDFRTGWLKHILWMKGLVEKASFKAPALARSDCAPA
jgi:uncharacterized protein YndB with AHSA1/START domain